MSDRLTQLQVCVDQVSPAPGGYLFQPTGAPR